MIILTLWFITSTERRGGTKKPKNKQTTKNPKIAPAQKQKQKTKKKTNDTIQKTTTKKTPTKENKKLRCFV